MTYGDRLQQALKNSHTTTGQLARALGVSPQAIHSAVKGQTRSLSAANNAAAAQFLRVSPDWLATGQGLMSPSESNVAAAPSLAPSRFVPVVGHVRGGTDGFLEEMQFPVGHGEGVIEYWTKDPAAYALRVKGDSMHPRYRAGEFIVVTPSIEALPGRDVVVKLLDGRKMLKQLNWMRSGELQLLSINDGYGPTTLGLDEIDAIHRVAGGVPADAFQESPH